MVGPGPQAAEWVKSTATPSSVEYWPVALHEDDSPTLIVLGEHDTPKLINVVTTTEVGSFPGI
jgi:hypothetical protein